MLKSNDFDIWADDYDQSVQSIEMENKYPFAGYKTVLATIYNSILYPTNRNGCANKVLDVGFGSGILSNRLYENGYMITGIDFSPKMIDLARSKMPNAELILFDFSNGLPQAIENKTFDFIICTYSLHHLDNKKQTIFIKNLLKHLSFNGTLFIGDISFETFHEMNTCMAENRSNWDFDEFYLTFEDLKTQFKEISFKKVSFCSGVFTLKNNKPFI